ALLGREHEDAGAILATDVGPLTVLLGGVVLAPEHRQQLLVADDRRIELDLDRLGMAGAAAAHGAVVGVVEGAPGLSDSCGGEALDLHEGVLHARETACCEDCLLCHIGDQLPFSGCLEVWTTGTAGSLPRSAVIPIWRQPESATAAASNSSGSG